MPDSLPSPPIQPLFRWSNAVSFAGWEHMHCSEPSQRQRLLNMVWRGHKWRRKQILMILSTTSMLQIYSLLQVACIIMLSRPTSLAVAYWRQKYRPGKCISCVVGIAWMGWRWWSQALITGAHYFPLAILMVQP